MEEVLLSSNASVKTVSRQYRVCWQNFVTGFSGYTEWTEISIAQLLIKYARKKARQKKLPVIHFLEKR